MMTSEAHQKITASHLARTALLYVRQSTLRQVMENTESTARQYALRDRAVALGWPGAQVVVEHVHVAVDAGVMHLEPDPAGRPLRVAVDADGAAFMEMWLAAVEHAQRPLTGRLS